MWGYIPASTLRAFFLSLVVAFRQNQWHHGVSRKILHEIRWLNRKYPLHTGAPFGITYLLSYELALQPLVGFDLLYNASPCISILCFLSPAFDVQLFQTFFYPIQPPSPRSSSLSRCEYSFLHSVLSARKSSQNLATSRGFGDKSTDARLVECSTGH